MIKFCRLPTPNYLLLASLDAARAQLNMERYFKRKAQCDFDWTTKEQIHILLSGLRHLSSVFYGTKGLK
ncbi:hypothetical protein MA16_Dca000319 [Dendrobium catenatum]|uniref:Uncharacterized protein n=1 Tax=Dendrobium catenatum TaxID=906689 RepID=A0A2I0WTJ0_9ASPA|nr:hypothetical protein MA16_Dca000319 [Dendrobium catenatum]